MVVLAYFWTKARWPSISGIVKFLLFTDARVWSWEVSLSTRGLVAFTRDRVVSVCSLMTSIIPLEITPSRARWIVPSRMARAISSDCCSVIARMMRSR
jgi:hypothetical protein